MASKKLEEAYQAALQSVRTKPRHAKAPWETGGAYPKGTSAVARASKVSKHENEKSAINASIKGSVPYGTLFGSWYVGPEKELDKLGVSIERPPWADFKVGEKVTIKDKHSGFPTDYVIVHKDTNRYGALVFDLAINRHSRPILSMPGGSLWASLF